MDPNTITMRDYHTDEPIDLQCEADAIYACYDVERVVVEVRDGAPAVVLLVKRMHRWPPA